MEILLSVEAENKYYSKELSNTDIRKELINNGFTTIRGENEEVIGFKFEDKILKNVGLREHKNCEVYIEIEFE